MKRKKLAFYLVLPFALAAHGFKKFGRFAKLQAKPALALLVAAIMLLSVVPMSVFAADEGSTGGVEIATAELPAATVGVAYSVTLSATPEGSTFFWNITGLPDGLTADYSGNITGTPEAAGSYTVSVSVGSTGGGSATKEMTLTVSAADEFPIYVGGVGMADGTYLANGAAETTTTAPASGGYAHYANGTLTLNNYSYSGAGYEYNDTYKYFTAIYSTGALNVVLVGQNSITNTLDDGDGITSYSDLTISGSGSLDINAYIGIQAREGDIEINGGIFNIINAYRCIYTPDNNITINDGSLNMTSDGSCISTNYGNVTINGGTLDITSSRGIWSNMESVSITGGKIDIDATVDGGRTIEASSKDITLTDVEILYPSGAAIGAGIVGKVIKDASGNTNIRVVIGKKGEVSVTHTVSFNANGGTDTMASVTVNDGATYTLPANGFTAPSGYKFSGWATSATGEVISGTTITVTADTTLYAIWEPNSYTVTFNSNGGSEVDSQSVGHNSYAYSPIAPSRAGYNFVGWFTDESLTTEYNFSTPVTKDMTLYAKWEKLPADAPTVEAGSNLTLTYKDYTDEQVSVSVTENDGYTYTYQWYDASTDQPISGATNAAYTVPNDLAAGSYSYYCVVAAKRDDNGETQSSKSSAIAVTVNKATLTADDFNFKGPDILVFHPANFKRATITPKDGVTGVGEITVQYFDEQGQPHNYAVDAGTYTVKINVTEGDNYLAANSLTADGWTFTITKGTQNAPTSPAGVAETVYGKNDGMITGVYDGMEYRKESETDADYKAITGEEITGLAAGTYYVRWKETDNLLASPPVTVTIAAGRMLTVTVPSAAEQIGYTIEAQTSCAYGATVEIKITALEGYGRDENFDVYNNGNLVSDKYNSATGILTLENVTEDVSITLASGSFVDRTKPTAEITIGTNKWNEFWNDLTFGLFFKETQTVTITADDKGSGLDKVYYYISETEMERIDVNHITEWQEYTGAFNIDPDRVAVIYVKAVDKAGNMWLVNSDGLVLDATAPTLEGIENGKTYYGDLTVIIPADQFVDIDQVTLDGETMTFAEGTYGRIPADNQEHTVVTTDKTGNKTEYKITVYKIYKVTFKHPTFDFAFPVNHGASFNQAHPDTVQDMVAEKDYHTFIGWYESTDGGETLKDTPYDFGAEVTGDVTLYPLFEIYTYTVTYKADGEVVGTITVEHGKDATAPAIPEKEGYTQTAPTWDKDGKNITADTEISAVYTINEYTVTFMDENGVYKTLTYKHGDKVEMPDAPAKDGYTVKWETTVDKATGDAVIRAVYSPVEGTPTTGDNSNIALALAAAVLCGAVALAAVNAKKKAR